MDSLMDIIDDGPLIECVPNFSEGRSPEVIEAIAESIRAVEGVLLLEVDPGYAANRTVMTFVGRPEAVVEAAFQAMRKAQELIDMSIQQGTHPRFGGTDVCPLVPLWGISLEEVVPYARGLAKRVGEELGYPVYCYEAAAFRPETRNLADVRKGEFECLPERFSAGCFPPDFGPHIFHKRSGATAIGARNFLIAYNVNLNTESVAVAKAIAKEVRESGYWKKGAQVNRVRIQGMLPAVKAIGWYIEEYGCAQVSMNLVDWRKTGVAQAFEAVKSLARKHGASVTGSELVGLIPLPVMLDAGRFYAAGEQEERALVGQAVEKLGLSDLKLLDPDGKIIEYRMRKMLQARPKG